jgi:hypothetical protein
VSNGGNRHDPDLGGPRRVIAIAFAALLAVLIVVLVRELGISWVI